MFKKIKKFRGSLTVEATMVLPIVIITLLFIANILNICMVNLCIQQAMNNTAKKISQDIYIVYRFAGEKRYEKFINKLNSINQDYDSFEGSATETKDRFKTLQTSAQNTVDSLGIVLDTFKLNKDEEGNFDFKAFAEELDKFPENVDKLVDDWEQSKTDFKSFAEQFKDTSTKGKDNIASIVIKLLSDEATGATGTALTYFLFKDYATNKLKVPSSRITDLNFLHSSLNADGSFDLIITYRYINPFSFVNSESMEYSVINKTIRMTNAIKVRPFIGENGTSLIKKDDNDFDNNTISTSSEIEAKDNENESTPSDVEEVKTKYKIDYVLYHYNKNCSRLKNIVQLPYGTVFLTNYGIFEKNGIAIPSMDQNGNLYFYGYGYGKFGRYVPCPICACCAFTATDPVWLNVDHSILIENDINVLFHKNKKCFVLDDVIENSYIRESNLITRNKKYKEWELDYDSLYYGGRSLYSSGLKKQLEDGTYLVKVFYPCNKCCDFNSNGKIDSNKTYYSIGEEIKSFNPLIK